MQEGLERENQGITGNPFISALCSPRRTVLELMSPKALPAGTKADEENYSDL